MAYTIFEYVVSAADAAINIFFLEKMFGYKRGKKNARYMFMLLYFIVSHYLMEYTVAQMICAVLADVLYCIFALKGKKHEQIIWAGILNVIYCIINSIMLPVLAIITGRAVTDILVAGTVTRIWMILIQKLVICVILWGILSYWGERLNLLISEKLVVILLIVTNIFIISGFFVVSIKLSAGFEEQVGLLAISILIIAALIACAVLVVKISAKNQQVMDNQIMRFQLENQGNMIEDMRRNNEEVRILRHDLKYYAVIIRDLLKNNNIEKALVEVETYLDKTVQAEQKTDYVKGNECINAVIYQSVSKCKENNIKCKIDANTNFDDDMERDIAIMLANLLDNAISAEAVVQEEKRYIGVEIFEEDTGKTVGVENYIENSVLNSNPELKTTKVDKQMHSFGLKSVKNIVEKYNGEFIVMEDKNIFKIITKSLHKK